MFPQNFNGGGDSTGDSLAVDVVITTSTAIATTTATATTAASGQKNGLWFRYVVTSISVFISHNVQDNDDHEAPPSPENSPEHSQEQPSGQISASEAIANDHVLEMRSLARVPSRVVRIVKDKDSNALQRLGGVDGVVLLQRSHFEGLEYNEADDGGDSHENLEAKGRGFVYFLFQAFNSYTIILLLVSAGLLFAIEFIEKGPQDGWHDGIAVLFAIFLLVAFSSGANFHRERKLLKKQLKERKKLKVERNGKSLQVDVGNVKVWDTVHLEKGDHIPAEGVFVSDGSLKLDEVHNSEINRDMNPFLSYGSEVKEGNGSMIVTSVGSYDDLHLHNLHGFSGDTLLQSLMEKPYMYIEKLALSMSVLIAFIALVRLLCKKRDGYDELPEMKGNLTMKLLVEMFERIILKPEGRVSTLVSALVTLVVGVQHGMPFVFGVCLSYWTDKLSNEKVSLQNISAGCTMGLVNVVIIDVTQGDLHKERSVEQLWMCDNEVMCNVQESLASGSILHHGIDVWDYNVPKFSDGQVHDQVSGCSNSKQVTKDLKKKSRVLEYRRTSSSGKRGCEVILRKVCDEEQSLHDLHWKGPPLTILEMCTNFYNCSGEIHAIESDQKTAVENLIQTMERNGLRPIALAYSQTKDTELKKDGLNLLAILGVKYARREDVKILINAFRNIRLNIKLVSEEELAIVQSIAWELGYHKSNSNDRWIEADEVQELRTEVDKITVMGKSQPKDKLQLVEMLQENDQIVAFVGGFTAGDTSTLIKADVGIAQKGICIKSANDSSDILLKSCSSDSLVRIANSGRCMYNNIQKFFQIQLTTWISGLTITLVSTMHSGESPITSIQMVWVNLILCLLGGLMMVMDFKSREDDQSIKRTESIITKTMWKNIWIQVCYQVCALLIFQFFIGTKYALTKHMENVIRTMIFNTYTLCQLFHLFHVMKLAKKEVLVVVFHSHWFLVALVTTLFLQVVFVQFGSGLLRTEKLNLRLWTYCFLLAALSLMFDSAMKLLISWFPDSSSTLNSVTTYLNIQRARVPCVYFLALPLFMLFLFSPSDYFHLDVTTNNR